MTEQEVHEAVGMILRRFPDFPADQEPVWVQSLALADRDAVFAAVAVWCENRSVWPMVVEIVEVVARMTIVMQRGKAIMWDAYISECERLGKTPTAMYLEPVS